MRKQLETQMGTCYTLKYGVENVSACEHFEFCVKTGRLGLKFGDV
jgi:hypothetical protein